MAKIKGYNELKKAIKNTSRQEWEIAINTNNQRGKVYNQAELLEMFPADNGDASGASKTCYILDSIVIKRQKRNSAGCFGNQVTQEINCFLSADDELKNILCPILAYYKVKSDKVNDESDKAYEKYLIIAQKCIEIDDFQSCCEKAHKMNSDKGYYNRYQTGYDAYRALGKILYKNDIHDWEGHPGNSGIIFDYEKGYYKAVLIDYGL
jgi:hypothetical protein